MGAPAGMVTFALSAPAKVDRATPFTRLSPRRFGRAMAHRQCWPGMRNRPNRSRSTDGTARLTAYLYDIWRSVCLFEMGVLCDPTPTMCRRRSYRRGLLVAVNANAAATEANRWIATGTY